MCTDNGLEIEKITLVLQRLPQKSNRSCSTMFSLCFIGVDERDKSD